MGKLPASLFYWGDFVRDPDLRRCTNAEVGVWIKCLCLMFEAEQKGVLATRGVAWTDEEVALAVGGKFDETNAIITTLVTKGVASRNEAGALFCRRMYRDEKTRVDTRRRVQEFRGRQKSNDQCNALGNANVRECTEAEAFNPLKSEQVFDEKQEQKTADKAVEEIWLAYPRKEGRGAAFKAIKKSIDQIKKTRHCGSREAEEFILGKTQEYAASPAGNQGTYTPHPSTWFNQDRYLDDPQTWQQNGGNNGIYPTTAERNFESAKRALELASLNPQPANGSLFDASRVARPEPKPTALAPHREPTPRLPDRVSPAGD